MSKRQVRDFKKVKEKGYGKKAKPTNFTKTSFKTKALVVPYQKVTDESRFDREEVTRRNLSLDELLVKLKHHNVKVRRDTLRGMREVISQFPFVLDGRLQGVLNGVFQSLSLAGENAKADQALVALIRCICSCVSEAQLEAHSTLLWAYLSSSFTHLKHATRVLGLEVLDVFLELCPSVLLSVIDEAKLMDQMASLMANKSQLQGMSVRHKIWHTLLLYLRISEQGEVDLSVPFGVLIVNDLYECIPTETANAAFICELLETLSHFTVIPKKALSHLSGNFPLDDDEGLNEPLLTANTRIACLLLSSQPKFRDCAAVFASSKLRDPSYHQHLRQMLLNACQTVWSQNDFGGSTGLQLAEALSALLGGRVSESIKQDCTPSLSVILSHEFRVPEEVVSRVLKFCAKTLWKSPTSKACTGILRSLTHFVRKPSNLANEFLSAIVVPVLAVQVQQTVRLGSFHKMSTENQVLFVRLFAGLSDTAPDSLLFAWKYILSSQEASLAFLDVLHANRVRFFPSIADYLSYLAALMKDDQNSLSVVLKLSYAMRDSFPEWHKGEFVGRRNLKGGRFALKVYEDMIAQMLGEKDVRALVMVGVFCGEGEEIPERFVRDIKKTIDQNQGRIPSSLESHFTSKITEV